MYTFQVVSDATSETSCGFCGDGVVQNSIEECEPIENATEICSHNGRTDYYYTPTEKTWGFETENWPVEIKDVTPSDTAYKWALTTEIIRGNNNAYQLYPHTGSYAYCSDNRGITSGEALSQLEITVTQTGKLSFWYAGSSDKNDDKLTITLERKNSTDAATTLLNGYSKDGNHSDWYQYTTDTDIEAGTYILTLRYEKDGDKYTQYLDTYCIDDLKFYGVGATEQATDPSSGVTCGAADSDNACKMSGTCYSYCGDGILQPEYEQCDTKQTVAERCANQEKEYYTIPAGDPIVWDFTSTTPPAEITVKTDKLYNVDYERDCSNVPSATPPIMLHNDSTGKRCYYNKGLKYNGGWQQRTINNQTAYCSKNTYYYNTDGNNNFNLTMAELELEIDSTTGGTISFNYYGNSENNTRFFDGLVVYIDKDQTYNGDEEFYNADLVLHGDKKDWTNSFSKKLTGNGKHTLLFRYIKDESGYQDVDLFCIDNLKFEPTPPATTQTDDPSTAECSNTCTKSGEWKCYSGWCGDGTKNGPEECDSGANNSDDWSQQKHCNGNCSAWAPYCGDGIKNGDEQCDDGDDNGTNESTCSKNCTFACGNEVLDEGELCDKGPGMNDGYGEGHCLPDCSGPATKKCGDGNVDEGFEQCELNQTNQQLCDRVLGLNVTNYYAPQSNTVQASCAADCKSISNAARPTADGETTASCRWCGDGFKTDGETCDSGNLNSDAWSTEKHCKSDCSGWAPYCGDTHFDTGEQCEKSENGDICYSENCADKMNRNRRSQTFENETTTFVYTGTIEEWIVPDSGIYRIAAHGARGGDGYGSSVSTIRSGCAGALVQGYYKLSKGQKLKILAGKRGGENVAAYYGGGGGGGSFVVLCEGGTCSNDSNTVLLVAAGGGGGSAFVTSYQCSTGQEVNNGSKCGNYSDTTYCANGGTNGEDGNAASTTGLGGKGWNTIKEAFKGANAAAADGKGNTSPYGGFGGGGSGSVNSSKNWSYSGGGSGYSGGGGGYYYGGGGGGSYFNTTYADGTPTMTAGGAQGTNGEGKVEIEFYKYDACDSCRFGNSYLDAAGTANQNAVCGDGFKNQSSEVCDSGVLNSDDWSVNRHCGTNCTWAPYCGDETENGSETCDDGALNSDEWSETPHCNASCSGFAPYCGDGNHDEEHEECDEGNDNGKTTCAYNVTSCYVCTSECKSVAGTATYCGDGEIQTEAGEECDDGDDNGKDCEYGESCTVCSSDCKPVQGNTPHCGDGIENGSEECDDGNDSNTDSCTNECKNAKCGDGFVQSGEECDDGNSVNTDTCTNACKNARCGDGFVQSGEECDDGNDSNTDSCTNACENARCGDSFVQSGEECDDGNDSNTDSCTNACKNARCGDSFVQSGETCDDGADNGKYDKCNSTCNGDGPKCGDGTLQREDCGGYNNCIRLDGANEQCDKGSSNSNAYSNSIAGKNCGTNCAWASYCGDKNIDTANGEECDDGNNTSGDGCSASCKREQVSYCSEKTYKQRLYGNSSGSTAPLIYQGAIEEFNVTESGIYEITAIGGAGGNGYYYNKNTVIEDGCVGAKVIAKYNLEKDDKLKILAGERGGQRTGSSTYFYGGGGGGGSFVVLCKKTDTNCTNPILLVAAGGGGGGKTKTTSTSCEVGKALDMNAPVNPTSSSDGSNLAGSNGSATGGKGWNTIKAAFTGTATEAEGKTNSYGTFGGYGGGGSSYDAGKDVTKSGSGGGGGYYGGNANNNFNGGYGGGSYYNNDTTYYVDNSLWSGSPSTGDYDTWRKGKVIIKFAPQTCTPIASACGDGKIQRSSCDGYEEDICEVLFGANEDCDKGVDSTCPADCSNLPACSSDSATPCKNGDLIWSGVSNDTMKQADAQTYCSNKTDGYPAGSWRLPTISELRELVLNCTQTQSGGTCEVNEPCYYCSNCAPTCNTTPHSIFGDTATLWSLSERDATNAWYLNFSNARIQYGAKTGSSTKYNTRCVLDLH